MIYTLFLACSEIWWLDVAAADDRHFGYRQRNAKKEKINRVGDRQLKTIPRQKRPSLELKAVLSNLPTCCAQSQ